MCQETEFRTQGYLTLEYLLGGGWWIVKMTKEKKKKKPVKSYNVLNSSIPGLCLLGDSPSHPSRFNCNNQKYLRGPHAQGVQFAY